MANPITLRKYLTIGAADAESDDVYLDECFVDTGILPILLDCQDPRCILLGRTGSGKTAILRRVLNEERAKELLPEMLALNYITNSNVLKFFEELGVKLDVFYQLLWRHILAIELIKLKYPINDKQGQEAFFVRVLQSIGRNSAKQRALKYLQEWGDKFWEETEYRTKEFTQKLETDLKASVGVNTSYVEMGAAGASKLSEEQRIEVKNRATKVVNAVQIKDLHEVIELLAQDLLNDKNKYYVVIDKLDENWVDDSIRFKLLRALLETVKTFKKVTCVKIIVGLRTDLHYHLFSRILDPGFQEEKYKSLYLNIKWTRGELIEVLNRRVNFMFKRQYTKADVGLNDIMPSNQMEKRDSITYVLDRTFFRPREAIIFLNSCIERAVGATKISVTVIRDAEVAYSTERLESLAIEWARDYPLLKKYIGLLGVKKQVSFQISDFEKEEIDSFALEILSSEIVSDPIYRQCEAYYDGQVTAESLLEDVCLVLYQVGVLGVKIQGSSLGRQWSYFDVPVLAKGYINSDATLDVHKTFWAALGVHPNQKTRTAEKV